MKKNTAFIQNTPYIEPENTPLLQQSLECTDQTKSLGFFARFGHILSIHQVSKSEPSDTVNVDFDGNPFGHSLPAKLGRGFRRDEIELAIDSQLTCRIDFINGDVNFPIVTDIFFSLLNPQETLILRAKKIVIEASKELIIQSGETQTRYSGADNRITSQAKYITSQAQKAQKIQGGTVSIN